MATNEVFDYGDQFDVAADAVTAPAEPTSSDAVAVDQLPAVAQTDPYTAPDGTSRITIKTNGVHDLPVTASAAAIEVGHIVHIHSTTGVVSNTATGGIRFGYALAAVANAATATIPVKVGY